MLDSRRAQTVHPLIQAFVVFHVVACTIWAVPKPSDAVLEGKAAAKGTEVLLEYNAKSLKENALIYGYLLPSGFWQYWDMFAPNPAQIDFWGSASVQFKDGSSVDGAYPRVNSYGLLQKYIMERHRKFFERAHEEKYSFVWPYFAQRIAFLNAVDPNNPPVRVFLTRNFQRVRRHDAPPGPESAYEKYVYFSYTVDSAVLFRDKGWQER